MKNSSYLIGLLLILNLISIIYCAPPPNSGKILYRLANPTGPTSGYTGANGW